MKNIKFLFLLIVLPFLCFISVKGLNKNKHSINDLSVCNEVLSINDLNLDLCYNQSVITESQIKNGLGSLFIKSFSRIEEASFEDTGGKEYYYEYSEIENNQKTVFISVFVYPDNTYSYSFSIDSDKVTLSYNSGIGIKIGDSLNKISTIFQSKGFIYNSQSKSGTINITDEGYLTLYFDNYQLISIEYSTYLT